MIPIVAQDLKATRIAYGYIRSDLTESNLLAGEVHEVLASEIRPERDLLTEVANRLRGMTGTRAIPARRDDRTRW